MRYLDHLVTHETCHQWWWNCVGTDGYAETFMDEGPVSAFTALRLDAKYGPQRPVDRLAPGLGLAADDRPRGPAPGRLLRLAGARQHRVGPPGPRRHGQPESLFSLAYDRGGKVVEMIRNRLGPERFFAFWRQIYGDYAWDTFRYEDLKRELAAFDRAPTGRPSSTPG
jgi:hypothetical protein